MIVMMSENLFKTSTGSVYSKADVENAIKKQIKRGFKANIKKLRNAICINFNFDTNEIELLDKYYVVSSGYTKRSFCSRDKAEVWKKGMIKRTGGDFEIFEVTKDVIKKESVL